MGLVSQIYTADDGPQIADSAAELNIFPFANNLGSRVITNGMATFLRCFYLRVWGRIITTLTPTLTIRIKVGSITFTIAGTLAAGASGQWVLDAPLFVRTPGAAGQVTINNGRFYYPAVGVTQQIGLSTVTAIDWTSNPEIQISFQFGTADPLNVLNCDAAVFEAI